MITKATKVLCIFRIIFNTPNTNERLCCIGCDIQEGERVLLGRNDIEDSTPTGPSSVGCRLFQ